MGVNVREEVYMRKTAGEITLILIGGFSLAIGINYFIIPNMLSEGGIIGLTVIVHYLFDWSPGIMNFVFNMALFLAGYNFFDRRTFIYTFISIGATSAFLYATESAGTMLTEDTLLASIFAGLLVGLGIGLIFRAGGTNGGTTVLARIANQLWGWSIGKGILITDLIIVAGSVFIIGLDKAMYTLITVYIGAKAINFIGEGLDERVAVLIMSNDPGVILERITNHMSRGLTVLEARGGYTGANKEVLYIVISRQEIVQLRKIVQEVDEDAYVTFHTVGEMIGEGFKAPKRTKKRLWQK